MHPCVQGQKHMHTCCSAYIRVELVGDTTHRAGLAEVRLETRERQALVAELVATAEFDGMLQVVNADGARSLDHLGGSEAGVG